MKVSRVLALSLMSADLTLTGCSATGLANALTLQSTYRLTAGVGYGSGARQSLDIYAPSHSQAGGRGVPVVVFFYGGSWQSGFRGLYRFVGEALASRGILTIVPDYRVFPEARFPAFMEDAARAVEWAHAHAGEYGGDSDRLFLMGHSAGAQIATLLVTDPHYLAHQGLSKSAIAGVIGLAGPYDFLPLRDQTLMQIFPEPDRIQSQPIHFVHGDEPPMLLAVGDRDKIVDPGNTTRFAARLAAANDQVVVRHFRYLGHLMLIGALSAPIRPFVPLLSDITDFISRQSASRAVAARQ